MQKVRRLLPITLYRNEADKFLKYSCVASLIFVLVCYFCCIAIQTCRKCCDFIQVILIPILISYFTAVLVTLFLNKQQEKIENRRLVSVRNEMLAEFFFSISNFFTVIAQKVHEEYRWAGETVDVNEKMIWYEWMQKLADILSSEPTAIGNIERREKYTKDMQERGNKISQEAHRLYEKRLSLYLAGIVSQNELHNIQCIGNMFSLKDIDSENIGAHLSAIAIQLKETIGTFEDYKFLNSECITEAPNVIWKTAEE